MFTGFFILKIFFKIGIDLQVTLIDMMNS